jgi:hypothetical protein
MIAKSELRDDLEDHSSIYYPERSDLSIDLPYRDIYIFKPKYPNKYSNNMWYSEDSSLFQSN